MTNTRTEQQTNPAIVAADAAQPVRPPGEQGRRGHRRWLLAGFVAAIAIIAAVVLALAVLRDDGGEPWQTADVAEQGGDEEGVRAFDGARLQRGADRLFAEVEVPTPQPGSYEYPTNDMIPDWVPSHPPVAPGASDAPEVFTAWIIIFNDPSACTDPQCDRDDFASDAPARGGVHQLDGRVADDDTLRFAGNIRVGQPALDGSPLDSPLEAAVHIAIAPHGRALSGTDIWIQLNSAVGNPAFWWGAAFPAG